MFEFFYWTVVCDTFRNATAEHANGMKTLSNIYSRRRVSIENSKIVQLKKFAANMKLHTSFLAQVLIASVISSN